jgi:hypothetical protein
MSHEIEKGTTGKGELAYVGAVPWHTLGSQFDHTTDDGVKWYAVSC